MMKHLTNRSHRLAAGVLVGLSGSALSACSQVAERWDRMWSGPAVHYSALGETSTGTLASAGTLAVNADHPALREAAIDVLRQAMNSRDPLLRANAIEAFHHAPEHLNQAVLSGLGDENRGVRFIAAMTAGRFKLCDVSHLVRPLLRDDSESVQAAAIFALRRCGERIDLNPLAQMVVSNNPEVKSNAALVLGELGEPSAIPLLRSAAGQGLRRVHATRAQIVDLQVAEAIVMLGDERELDVIRASLFAPVERAEVVALAALMCGRLDDGRAVPNLTDLAMREGTRQLPPEVRMAATLALAQISAGQPSVEVPLHYARSDRPELRAQAAMTLGAIRSRESLESLRHLLADPSPYVQVSAAAGILQHLDR